MAQGLVKKKAPKAVNAKRQQEKAAKTKKGARAIAPKQTVLIKQRILQKKLSAKINNNIERQMSVKANAVGKLTVMKKVAEEASSADNKKKGKK